MVRTKKGVRTPLAVPAAVVSVVVMALLVLLAVPLVPVAIDWTAGIARGAASGPMVAAPEPPGGDAVDGAADAPAADPQSEAAPVDPADTGAQAPNAGTDADAPCRALYSDAAWAELTARAGTPPGRDAAAPPIEAPSVLVAAAPVVRETCTWNAAASGSIVTTVADVADGTGPIVAAALGSDGFACETFGDGIRCVRTDDETVRDVTVRDRVWLSSVQHAWHPTGYTEQIAGRLWPQ